MRGLRITGRFFAIGALLLVAKQAYGALAQPESVPLVVEVPACASSAEAERQVQEALLLNEALRLELHRTDAVLRDRLLRNMRFADPETKANDDALFEQALGLGMPLSDPVARARLLDAMRRRLLTMEPPRPPTSEQLRAYVEAHAERFERPEVFAFHQVFVSHALHGERTEAVARERLGELRRDHVGPDQAASHGDSSALPTSMRASANRIDGRFGEGFAEGLAAADPGRWQGPVGSSFGKHLVWLGDREPASLPPLSEIERSVRTHFAHDAREHQLRVLTRKLAEHYRVETRWQPCAD